MLSRRFFLGAGLSTLPLAARNRIDRSRLSAITDEIGRSPEASIAFVKQYGLQWVELRNIPGQRKEYAYLTDDELQAAARQFKENGLKVSFLNSSLMKVALPGIVPARWLKDAPEAREKRLAADKVKFERRMEDLAKGLRAAHILGVDKFRVFTGWRGEDPKAALPTVARIIREMADVAAKEKVHLLVENEGGCTVATCAELAELMRLVSSKWVGLNWDPLNGTAFQEPPYPEGYRMLPNKRILNVQIKGRSILDGPQRLDWAAIFQILEKDGYKGQVGLETHIFGDGQIQASHDSMKVILKLVQPT